jgi:hypothetical protein
MISNPLHLRSQNTKGTDRIQSIDPRRAAHAHANVAIGGFSHTHHVTCPCARASRTPITARAQASPMRWPLLVSRFCFAYKKYPALLYTEEPEPDAHAGRQLSLKYHSLSPRAVRS